MKIKTLVGTAALSLLLGSTALVWAQEDHNDAKPPQEPRPEEIKPSREEAKPAREEAKPARQAEARPEKQEEAKPVKRDEAKPSHDEHAAAAQHGRIPDDKFRSHFGSQHKFAVKRVTVVEGQPRFQYSGYSFALVDAWPVGWGYSDDCYIDYIDGEYFLFDLLHPGARIAIVVVL